MTSFIKNGLAATVPNPNSTGVTAPYQTGKMLTPIWYPALTVNLRLRFDEAYLVDNGVLPTPQAPNDKAGQGGFSGLSAAKQTAALATGQATSSAKKLDTSPPTIGGANLSQVYNIVPRMASIELPGYRQAGHFSMKFAWQDLPLDPRAIRSIGIDVFAAAIDPASFASGMTLGQASGGQVGAQRPSMFSPNGVFGFSDSDHLLLTGVVDQIDQEFDEKTATLTIEGRDLRGLLLDSPIQDRALAKLDLKLPIDQFVQSVLDLHPQQEYRDQTTGKQAKWFVVEPANPNEWSGGRVPSPAAVDDVTAFRVSVQGNKPMQSPMGQPSKLNFWDVITNYCYLVGAIPYFTNRTIKVRPSRSIFDLTTAGDPGSTVPTPFGGGARRTVMTDSGPDSFGVRRLVYGRDVRKLSFARKCGGVQTPVVTVVSFNPATKDKGKGKLLQVTYPSADTVGPNASAGLTSLGKKVSAAQHSKENAGKLKTAKNIDATKRTAVSSSGESAELQTIRISVPGIASKDKLTQIARSLYEEIGRQEIGGQCSTNNLASQGGDNGDPDLLRLRPGDAVQLLVDARALSSKLPQTSPLIDLARMDAAQAVEAIKKRLGLTDDNLARALVASQKTAAQQFNTYFRVANVKYTWASESGMAIAFDFQNYVQARAQVDSFQSGRA